MRRLITLFILLATFGCSSNHEIADSVFINGLIYTLDSNQPKAEAVAILDGKIQSVGNNETIKKFAGDKTEIIDLNGKFMTPGFIEGHAHFMGVGYASINLDLSDISSFEELIEKVENETAQLESGSWIVGRGWHQDKWDSISAPIVHGFPVHRNLSLVTPNHPVYLKHASGHAALANAKAMELAGVNMKTEFVDGGEIIKDQDGQPTGIFNEAAQSLVERVIPANDPLMDQRAYEAAQQICLENGITSFHDAGIDQQTIDLYKKNLENRSAKIRLYAMLSGSDSTLLSNYYKLGPETGLGDDRLTIRSIKVYSDGALGSRGAWLLEDYEDMEGEFGHAIMPMGLLSDICDKAIETGFQVCTHAIGDRANREVLDQYESAFSRNSNNGDLRFRIEHAQHLNPADIPRFSQLGVLPAMQAIHMSSDRPWAIDRLGSKRIVEGAYVWQDLLKSGAKIVNGTDAPVEPIDPIACFFASVTRKTLKGKPPEGYEPIQKMSRLQALRSYTLDAAYGAFEERIKGSIEAGKMADFTVFDSDIMTIPEEQILNSKVVMTVIGGEVVFEL